MPVSYIQRNLENDTELPYEGLSPLHEKNLF